MRTNNLPEIDRPDKELMADHLKKHSFSDAHIEELKLHRHFVVICDGYDESQLTINLHNANTNSHGQWQAKMLVTCLTQYLGHDYRSHFMPKSVDEFHRSPYELFQEAVIAPFSNEQIQGYINQYVLLEAAQEPLTILSTSGYDDLWNKLTVIPNLMNLVLNPFLLTLALRYCKRLAQAIYRYQDGAPVVEFSRNQKEEWKAEFFGPKIKTTLLREASPLTRAGNRHWFIHKSLLDYFYSRTFFDPDESDVEDSDDDDDDPQGGGGNSFSGDGDSLVDGNGGGTGSDGATTSSSAALTGNNGGSSDGIGNLTNGELGERRQ
ncbi:hypothetical protein BGZ97_004504 [Linnemannia gamsii]|uniref:Uncharacterized protein n=1 Tax=Linnemannia gamsii TaxID=64522 RepID=A0A9P6QUA5_9FUNG|nr:hypothetical protein BGZ97_004504 [Linnemannia gamsii]